jgi:hypothetical protein
VSIEQSKIFLKVTDTTMTLKHTNNIEGAWKIFKNSSRDMYNHVSRKHIQLYVDEFVYRYNMRSHIEKTINSTGFKQILA